MNRTVRDELKHIPRGKDWNMQSRLRYYYNALRRNYIRLGKSKEVTLAACIETVHVEIPTASPLYDTDYFNF